MAFGRIFWKDCQDWKDSGNPDFKPVILGGKFGDIDSDTDYSDMPPLEESPKKNKEDSEEDSEEDNYCETIEDLELDF